MENCELEEKLFAPKKTRQVLHIVPSGEIATELGADGLWLRFETVRMLYLIAKRNVVRYLGQ